MARKKRNQLALTGAQRIKMYRQRKKLLSNQNERVNEYYNRNETTETPNEEQNTGATSEIPKY